MEFPTKISEINARIAQVDPVKYASTRNYGDGALTYLSPYISRGVISTKHIYEHLKTSGFTSYEIEKLVQELAWRDYWQHVWIEKGNDIHTDLKNTQLGVSNHQLPKAINEASTGIDVIDNAIESLYETGYMHNHIRMYVASISCNLANSHWLVPSRWMYANLLDGDLASNQLSWQWVAGAFSNKKYYANQENINNFFYGSQKNTFLDVEYDQFDTLETPSILLETVPFEIKTKLPKLELPKLDPTKKTLIYNYYNLDPNWHAEEDLQRVLLLEPSIFESYPIQEHCIEFALRLSENIPDIIIFVEEFSVLIKQVPENLLIFKEHPLNKHYRGTEEARDWMSSVTGYFPSFFAFWKKCKKELFE